MRKIIKHSLHLTFKMLMSVFLVLGPSLSAQDYSHEQLTSLSNSYFEVNSDWGTKSQLKTKKAKNITKVKPIVKVTLDTLYLGDKPKMFLCQDGENWVIFANEQSVDPIVCKGEGHLSPKELQESPLWFLLTESMIGLDSLRISEESTNPNIRKAPTRATNLITNSTKSTSTPTPLLDGNLWSQAYNNDLHADIFGNLLYNHSNIYNRHSPTFYNCVDGKTWVGCTAVAMAQVMWFHQWPSAALIPDTIKKNGITSKSKTWRFYNWSNMPKVIENATPLSEVDELTYLLRDCAYAGNMVYWSTGSSMTLTNAKSALEKTFNYTTKMKQYSAGVNAWNDKIKGEIANNRPVIIQATHATDGSVHSFIIDGYNSSNNTYHINMGHGNPKTNIWYSIAGADCYGHYTIARRMLYEIIPNRSHDKAKSPRSEDNGGFTTNGSFIQATLIKEGIYVTCDDEYTINWTIYDMHGNKVEFGAGKHVYIDSLPNGAYIFVAASATSVCQLKFVK